MKNAKGVTDLTANEEKLIEALSDLANGLESIAVNLRHQISEIIKINEEAPWDPDKIKWEQTEGSSGPYERSEDVNSLDFKAMLKDLAAHQGKLTRDDYFFWTFKNGATVGRKKRKT
jgi:hypothetical protein